MPANLVSRWIFSPLESVPSPMVDPAAGDAAVAAALYPPADLPIVAAYCDLWDAPWHHNGYALVNCTLDITHLMAAQKDPRLTVCPRVNDATAIDAAIVTAWSDLGAVAGMTMRQLLEQLEILHVNFCVSD